MNKKILIYLLIVVVLFCLIFKNKYNLLIGKIISNKVISFSDDFTSNYINELENDIKEYKDISNIKDCINASVIYRNPVYWYDEFTINKGIKDGIEKGYTVINDKGIVGVIKDVHDNYSIISLITNINANNKITVGIKADETIYGIISNYDKLKDEIIVSELTSTIENGNYDVITTNYTDLKSGIIIGKVKNIIDDSNGLSKNAIVKPIVNYNDIRYVCVIK